MSWGPCAIGSNAPGGAGEAGIERSRAFREGFETASIAMPFPISTSASDGQGGGSVVFSLHQRVSEPESTFISDTQRPSRNILTKFKRYRMMPPINGHGRIQVQRSFLDYVAASSFTGFPYLRAHVRKPRHDGTRGDKANCSVGSLIYEASI